MWATGWLPPRLRASKIHPTGVEGKRIDFKTIGIEEEVEPGVFPVDRPGKALGGENVVHRRPKLCPGAACALADAAGRNALQAGNSGGGANGVGIVCSVVTDLLEALGCRGVEIEQFEDGLRTGDRPARETAGEYLCERSEIRSDAEIRLRAAGRYAETGHNFVEDEHDAASGGHPPEHVDEFPCDWQNPEAPAGRLEHNCSDVVAGLEESARSLQIVGTGEQDVVRNLLEQSRGCAAVEVVVHTECGVVLPAVEVTHQADQLPLSGEGASEAQRHQVCFRAGRSESHSFCTRHKLLNE